MPATDIIARFEPCGTGHASVIARLRHQLADKFPAAETKPGGVLPTGLSVVDEAEGGVRLAAVTEFTGTTGAGTLFLCAMREAIWRARRLAALVDAGRSWEAEHGPSPLNERLLLVQCSDAMQAIKATDLLLRDGNLALVLLDFQGLPAMELRRIPANTWHRLHRLAEESSMALVVLTRQPIVEAAQVRVTSTGRWPLGAQRQTRRDLLAALPAQVFLRRSRATAWPPMERQGATA
jgi:hypothetical protein